MLKVGKGILSRKEKNVFESSLVCFLVSWGSQARKGTNMDHSE